MFIIKKVTPSKELLKAVRNKVGDSAREMLLYNVCTFKQFVAMSGISDSTVRFNCNPRGWGENIIPPKLDTIVIFKDGTKFGGKLFIILNEKSEKVIIEQKF